ncbi:hypothetical protein PR048_008180 [Dryococelus australis]|uniref:Uncharacterized protein n=1 Tax=Dryococelus australis TaxID=614101 RepID=A0ABQ9HWD0_9NEOP|nr:hypothetical protein PR048_008180 [Dryococelus australis]
MWCGRNGVVVRLLGFYISESDSIPGGVAPGFSPVENVSDVAAVRWVFSGISRFPYFFIPALLHTHLTSPSSGLKTSMFRAAHISSLAQFRYTKRYFSKGNQWLPGVIHAGEAADKKLELCRCCRIPSGPVKYANAFSSREQPMATDKLLVGRFCSASIGSCCLLIFVAFPPCDGATMVERLDGSLPTKAHLVQFPAGSLRIFASGNCAGRCHWSAGILGDLPFPPPLHSDAAPCLPHITLVGPQDLAVKR